jgi:cell division protein FtsN
MLTLAATFGAQAQTGIPATPVDTTSLEGVPRSTGAALPRPANDSLFRRARRMVGEGNGPAGRALVDSLLRAATPGTPAYGDALYWHGALAATATDAERDYRRVIVEYPLAYYADDALLAIAELEQARGDRAAALGHLQRYVRGHPVSSERGIAALGAARLAFEQRDTRTGCAMLAEARGSLGTNDVELRNQVEYYAGRCLVGATGAAAAGAREPVRAPTVAPSVATVAPPAPAPARSTMPPPARSSGTSTMKVPSTYVPPVAVKPTPSTRASAHVERYTVQLAAYDTRPDAERLVTKLASRGVRARVSGTTKPFRVRLDFYRTQREAAAVVAALKARGMVGFVTTEVPPPGATSP